MDDRQWVEGLVEELVREVDGPPFDPRDVARVRGIKILRTDLPWPARAACLIQRGVGHPLLLHHPRKACPERWLLAHEVLEVELLLWGRGHEGLEDLADYGADALLMPRSYLRGLDETDVVRCFAVPEWMAKRRLEALTELEAIL